MAKGALPIHPALPRLDHPHSDKIIATQIFGPVYAGSKTARELEIVGAAIC